MTTFLTHLVAFAGGMVVGSIIMSRIAVRAMRNPFGDD